MLQKTVFCRSRSFSLQKETVFPSTQQCATRRRNHRAHIVHSAPGVPVLGASNYVYVTPCLYSSIGAKTH